MENKPPPPPKDCIIIKSLYGEGDACRSGVYGASNFWYYGIPEFTAFGGTVCLVNYCLMHSRMNKLDNIVELKSIAYYTLD